MVSRQNGGKRGGGATLTEYGRRAAAACRQPDQARAPAR